MDKAGRDKAGRDKAGRGRGRRWVCESEVGQQRDGGKVKGKVG